MFPSNFGWIDWAIVVAYLAGTVAIGVRVNRYVHGVADYMVGGRASGVALNTATYIGTGLGLVTLMYASIDGFQRGFSFLMLALIGALASLTLGLSGFVICRLRRLELTTLPEFFELRYGRRTRVIAGVVCALAGILNMGLFPKMGATFIAYATGLARPAIAVESTAPTDADASDAEGASAAPPSPALPRKAVSDSVGGSSSESRDDRARLIVNLITSALIVLALLYTVLGGMVSVIVTDYLQFVVLSLGMGIGLLCCLGDDRLGWTTIVDAWRTRRGEPAFNPLHADSYGLMWIVWQVCVMFVALLAWAPEASRALTASDSATARRTFLWASPNAFVRLALPAFWGIAAFALFSQGAAADYFFPDGLAAPAQHAEQAMPLLLGHVVPSGLLGLLAAGLLAALMSTHDSYLLCWSSVLVRDVVGPLRRRPATAAEEIRLTRWCIVAIGVFLLAWGVWYETPSSVWSYMAVTGTIYLSGAGVALVGGLYWRRASSAGALAALLGGLTAIASLFVAPLRDWATGAAPGLLPYITDAHLALATFLVSATLFVAGSLLLPDRAPRTLQYQDC